MSQDIPPKSAMPVAPQAKRPFRWHRLYYVLAAFDLLTVCATLFLSHRVNIIYGESLRVNREWAEMLTRFSDLGQLASQVNAPGNDVFDSHDVPTERSRMVEALAAYYTAMSQRRRELEARPAGEDVSDIARHLDETEQAMGTMVDEANLIFSYFERQQPQQAGSRMATMDRKYALVNTALASLRKAVSDVQGAAFSRQAELAAQMRAYEYFIGLLVGLMVVGVAFYGHYMGRQAERAAELAHIEEEAARLQRAHEDLEQRVRARTAELAAEVARHESTQEELVTERDRAEQMNRAKSTFLATMSHELRTPLNAIIGYTELLKEEMVERENTADLTPDLDRIRAAGLHQLSLVNDILDLSKIEAERMELASEKFDIAFVVEEVVSLVKPLVEPNRNNLEVRLADRPLQVNADLTRVRQCLMNLLSNACKFTENGRITVSVHSRRIESRDWVDVEVSDTGIGLTQEQLGRLFQPFTQADGSMARKYGGSGLGLMLTQRFSEMMNGQVLVYSEAGRGSTFTLRLPEYVSGEEPVSIAPLEETVPYSIASPSQQGTVLVIDDDPMVHEWMQRFLTAEGYQVAVALTGEEGLEMAARLKPAAITLDVIMPGMDGWQVLAALKGDPALASIRVILLTMADCRRKGYALGADEFLNKPLDASNLLNILGRYRREQFGRGHILVVEDDSDTSQVMARTLNRQGWSTEIADNGLVALERMRRNAPALVLLDLMMPVMDGFHFLHEKRADSALAGIPVIVLTAKDLSADDRRELSEGVARVMVKGSLERSELIAEVSRLLNSRQPVPAEASAD